MTAPTFRPPINPAGRVSDNEYGLILGEFIADTPSELIWPLSVQTYAGMRRDACVSAVLDGYLLQLLRATWQLDGRDCDPELTKMVADDMGLTIVGAEPSGAARVRGVSWEQHIEAALSTKLVFGHAGFALAADLSSGRARLSALADRLPQTLTEIHADPKTGEFLGVTQDVPRRNGKPQIRARDMVWYCRRREGANWAGTSMFRSSWVPFMIKREMLRIHATSNRRWGMGIPVMEALPGTAPSPAQMSEAMQMAAAARGGEQSGAATPPGFTMKIMGLTGAVPDTLDFIRWLDMQISRAALMPHMELGQGTSGGSRALGTAFIDSFTLALETLATQTAMEATRQIAARAVEWNRGIDEPVPQVVVSGIGSRREVTAESLNILLQSGALSADPGLEQWIRREYRLPEREETAAPTGRAYEFDIANGVVTPNERRAQIGLPPVAGGDTLRDPNAPAPPAADRTPVLPQPEPKVAAKRKLQAAGQLELPIAAAATDDGEAQGVQAQYEAALAALLAGWPVLAAPLVDDLVGQVDGSDVGGLAGVAASAAVVDGIAATLLAAMTALATQAAAQVVASAAAQGVTVDQPEPDGSRLAEIAAVTGGLIAAGYTTAAVRRAMLAPVGVAGALVRTALNDMTVAQRGMVADNLGAALSAAQGQGRLAVLAFLPVQQWRASEVNDSARCEPCQRADQRVYDSLADALRDYPDSLRNAACLGGARCRGHIEPVWP